MPALQIFFYYQHNMRYTAKTKMEIRIVEIACYQDGYKKIITDFMISFAVFLLFSVIIHSFI
jgi:hypothetical protein